MKGYFKKKLQERAVNVSQESIDCFRIKLNKSFEKAGAEEIANIVPDATIRNAIRGGVSPDDVVWAWMQ